MFQTHTPNTKQIVQYNLNNYKFAVKTQHVISVMLYSDMFRLMSLHQCIFKPYLSCTK